MAAATSDIFTIGHGNRKISDFIHLLKKYNIDLVVDVRTYPYSRFHAQYRKAILENSLKEAGVAYLFLGEELGGRPKNPDLYFNGKVSYDAIKQTDVFKAGIQQVSELVNEGARLTLMCSESDQNHCHRKLLITNELINEGFKVVHINKQGNLEDDVKDEPLQLLL